MEEEFDLSKVPRKTGIYPLMTIQQWRAREAARTRKHREIKWKWKWKKYLKEQEKEYVHAIEWMRIRDKLNALKKS